MIKLIIKMSFFYKFSEGIYISSGSSGISGYFIFSGIFEDGGSEFN